MKELSSFELGWLVGVLEGEGCFFLGTNKSKTPYITVSMTDEDSVCQIASYFERLTGKTYNVREYAPRENSHTNFFVIKIGGDDARLVMRTIVKYMKQRRRQKIWQCLNGFEPIKIDFTKIMSSIKEKINENQR